MCTSRPANSLGVYGHNLMSVIARHCEANLPPRGFGVTINIQFQSK